MLAISGRIELATIEQADIFVEHALKVMGPTHAEPGCLLYAMARDITDSKVIWISEEWESEAALKGHLTSEHISAFLQAISTLEMTGMDARQYEVASVGPVSLPE